MVRGRDAGRVSYRLNSFRNGFGAYALLNRLRGRGRSRVQTAHSLGMLVDALENRTLLSTLPAPSTTYDTLITNYTNNSNNVNYSSPSVAYDPSNPQHLVEAAVMDDPNSGVTQKVFIELAYSVNGGATWSTQTIDNVHSPSPNSVEDLDASSISNAVPYADATDPTVGFDLNSNVFISFSEHTPGNDSGAIVVSEYSFAGNSLSQEQNQNPVYKWHNNDSAWVPTMAVDDNPATFVDPNGDGTLGDASSGNIYVAWASRDTEPTNPQATPYNPDRAMMAVAVDNAADTTQQLAFSAPMEESVYNANLTNEINSNVNGEVAVPKLVISAGSLEQEEFYADGGPTPEVVPGQVSIVWDDISSGRSDSPKDDPIDDNAVDPGNTYTTGTDSGTLVGSSVQLFSYYTRYSPASPSLPENSAGAEVYPAATAAGTGPVAVATGIFKNSFSFTDAAVLDKTTGTVSILIGNGNDTFTALPGAVTSTFTSPVAIASGDFDKDGKIDLMVVDANGVWVLPGNGDGTFSTAVEVLTLSGLNSLAIGDINGDGTTDFAVTDFATNNVITGINTSTGAGVFTFNTSGVWGVGNGATGPESVAIGDVNGDNVQDLIVADYTSNTVSVLLGTNTGGTPANITFTARAPYTPAFRSGATTTPVSGPHQILLGDINGDNLPDIVVVANNGIATLINATAGPTFALTVYNGGNANSGLANPYLATNATYTFTSAALLNITGTGLDLAITDANYGVLAVATTNNNGSFTMEPSVFPTATGTPQPMGIAVASFNSNDKNDLLVANFGKNNVSLFAIPSSANAAYGTTDFTFNVNVPATNFTLSNLSIDLEIQEPDLTQLSAKLITPVGTFNLFFNRDEQVGQTVVPADGDTNDPQAYGLSGTDLGYVDNATPPGGPALPDDLVINDEATRSINDPNVGLYVGDFRQEENLVNQDGHFGTYALGPLLTSLNGQTSSTLNGPWTLEFTTYIPSTVGQQSLNLAKLIFTSGTTPQFSTETIDTTHVLGTLSNSGFNLKAPSDPSGGVGPGVAITSDDSLGGFSEFEGRLYAAFTALTTEDVSSTNAAEEYNTEIVLYYSDNGGRGWTEYVNPNVDTAGTNQTSDAGLPDDFSVNDDNSAIDGFSGTVQDDTGNWGRSQYEPSLAVDPTNGTLVATWYDARYDAADARVARYVTTSIDGGYSFGAQTYLNAPNQVYNAITGQAQDLGPIPDNISSGNPNNGGQYSFGGDQGLTVYGGNIYAAWSGNNNGGNDGKEDLNILTSTTTFASGPRIINSTQGVVSTPEDVVNPAIDNSPAFQYVDVTFDRPVDPSTFTTTSEDGTDPFHLYFRDINTPGTQAPADISNLIADIIPLNLTYWGNALALAATEFRIVLSSPQTAPGTYTYSIDPVISNGFDYFGLATPGAAIVINANQSTANGTIANAMTGQTNLTVPQSGTDETDSIIQIPTGVGTDQPIVNVEVNVVFDGPIDGLTYFELILKGPNNVMIPLAYEDLGAVQTEADLLQDLQENGQPLPGQTALAGHGYISTTFNDNATTPIRDGNFQFSGTFQPEAYFPLFQSQDGAPISTGTHQSLATFDGVTLADGDKWTLEIISDTENNGTAPTGFLSNWSIEFQTAALNVDRTSATFSGNVGQIMDQNGDAVGGTIASSVTGFQTIGDVFAMPSPLSASSYTTADGVSFFAAPYSDSTSAIVVPGPSLLTSREYDANVSDSEVLASNGSTSADASGTVPNDYSDTLNSLISPITITTDNDVVVTHLVVKVKITDPTDSNLVITLIGPDGTPVTLADEPSISSGGTTYSLSNFGDVDTAGNDNLGPVVFADDASTSIQDVDANLSLYYNFTLDTYGGLYKPASALSQLNGEKLNGTWTLEVRDIANDNAGATLDSWSLTATTTTSATDQTVGQTKIYFSGPMNVNSVTSALAQLVGPTGTISGLAITPIDDTDPVTGAAFTDYDPVYDDAARTFVVTFPAQTLTGTYLLTLPSTIEGSYEEDGQYVPLDTDLNAGLETLRDESASTTKKTYTATGAQTSLTLTKFSNDGIVDSTITVLSNESALIKGISVTLNVGFPNASELSAVLIAPNGMAVQLFGNLDTSTGSSNQIIKLSATNNLILTDLSSVTVNTQYASLNGSYSPQQPLLSTLLNTPTGGVWTLQLKVNGADQGTFKGWSLSFTVPTPDNGTGQSAEDSVTVPLTLFNLAADDQESHQEWSPVGSTATNSGANSEAGPVTAMATDPSDPSGNTVYIAAATGGVWKTTNFLTSDPNGPTYIPLETANDALGADSDNIGALAVLGSQINPATGTLVDSMIFAATGELTDSTPGAIDNAPGIGVLVSLDGGSNWNVATGLVNTDSSGAWLADSARTSPANLTFVGLIATQIVVDPHLQPNGQAIIYVSFTDPNGSYTGTTYTGRGGIYRSVDSGHTWTLMKAGQATDVILDLNSGVPNFRNSNTGNATENVNIIYGAFAGVGVFKFTGTTSGVTSQELLGTAGDPNILDADLATYPSVTLANKPNPNGSNGRIVLAMPAPTGNSTEDVQYEGWIYAAVVANEPNGDPEGTFVGLYMTKDDGATWTKVDIDYQQTANANGGSGESAAPTNNFNQPSFDVTNGVGIPQGDGNYALALAIDPSDPNVVYLAGSSYADRSAGMIRVDTTGIADSHAFYMGNTAPDGGTRQISSTDVDSLRNYPTVENPYPDPLFQSTINLLQNPAQPFVQGGQIFVSNTLQISNNGSAATWIPFDQAFTYPDASLFTTPTPSEYHRIVAETDPLTGQTRLIIATDQGVYTAVDEDGTFRTPDVNQQNTDTDYDLNNLTNSTSTSLNETPIGSRNGNLQIAEMYYGAVQPSQGAADAIGSLFYGEAQGVGLIESSANVLTTGDTQWTAPTVPSGGRGVAVDETGGVNSQGQLSPSVYDYSNPFLAGTGTDFFQVNGVGRTTGLVNSYANGPTPTYDFQWPAFIEQGNGDAGSNFAVNPVNGEEVVISSQAFGPDGPQLYATENQGESWGVIADPTALDGSYAPALAYGAPTTGNAVDDFIFAGTQGSDADGDKGNIYVTFTGGGNGTANNWTQISTGLDGSAIQSIVTDPIPGSYDVYAITQNGVFYADVQSVAQGKAFTGWTSVSNGSLTAALAAADPITGVSNLLTALTADWRYGTYTVAAANAPTPAITTPILYLGADDGVYQGIDKNGTWDWSPFPDNTNEGSPAGAPPSGGDLPDAKITDLDLSLGNVSPAVGLPQTAQGNPNVLMASTFGGGAYAIRLAPIVSNPTLDPSTDTGVSNVDGFTKDRLIEIDGTSEKTIPGFNIAGITIYAQNADGSLTYLGGYNPNDSSTSTTDPEGLYNPANETDDTGAFHITTTVPLPANGTFNIVVQATDSAGVVGSATINSPVVVTIATSPPVISQFTLTAGTQSGTTVDGVEYTNVNPPTISGAVHNQMVQSQSEQGTVVTIYVDGNEAGTATVDASNNFIYTLPAALSQGQHTITASALDPVGNASPLPNVSLTIDIITSIATPSAPVLAPASDSGVSNSDDLTKVTNPTFTGTAAAGDLVTLKENDNADGTATADANGNYSITVPNALVPDGTYAITVTQTDLASNISDPSPALDVTIDTTAPVIAGATVNAHQYGTLNGIVGTITDLHPTGSAPIITWGDGTNSTGTLVTTSNPDVDDIEGSHVYQTTGTFSISITGTDAAGNAASTSSSGSSVGSVTVTPPAPAVTVISISANEGQTLSNISVASFTNGAPNPTAGEFSATIDWGDGSAATTGTIVPDPSAAGYFLVQGSHTYTDGPNNYTLTVTVNATGVATPSVATGTASIANVPPAVTLGGTTTGFINQIIALPITATDPGIADTAAGFTYNISWGDGTTTSIAATANDGTGQSPTHVYGSAGTYTITVTATDKDGGMGTASESLQIAPAPTLSNVVFNYGQTQRSHMEAITFTLSSTTVPITALDTTDLALVYDGSTIVPLTNAAVTYNAATGQATVNLANVSLANGDYQLFVFPGTGVLPINFTKVIGDTDGDGFVTKTDQKLVKADQGAVAGQSNYNPDADVNGDGVVNATDLSLLQLDKTRKITVKTIKLLAGKVIKPKSLKFPTMATNATRAVPIQLQLVNSDPSRPLTITDVGLLGGGANFSFAVLNQTYGQTTFTIAPGGTLVIRMYFTPTGAGSFSTQLKAQLSNDVQATYGAVIAKFSGKATVPKKTK